MSKGLGVIRGSFVSLLMVSKDSLTTLIVSQIPTLQATQIGGHLFSFPTQQATTQRCTRAYSVDA